MLKSVRFSDLLPDEVEARPMLEPVVVQQSDLLYAVVASSGRSTTLVVLGHGGSVDLSPHQLRQLIGRLTERLAVVEAQG